MSVRLLVSDLVTATGGRLLVPRGATAPTEVTGVTTDSRTVKPGDLFVALRGPHTDGHRFVADAASRGAVLAILTDPAAAVGPALAVPDPLRALGAVAALHRRSLPATVVAITGSVGKTTTVGLCATVLEQRFRTARSADSWNAEVGVALSLLRLDASHEVAVLEFAMRGLGQIRELVEMARPRIGVVTNIGDTHLELLGSRENIAAAKAELLDGLPAGGVAVVNADDPNTPRLLRGARCPVATFGFASHARVRATDAAASASGTRFALHLGPRQAVVRLPLVGRHQMANALAAAAVGDVMGVPIAEIVHGLERAQPPAKRQRIMAAGGLVIIDDSYNASPQSMLAAFDVVAHLRGDRRLVLALGEMLELGPGAEAFHRQAGAQAAALRPEALLAVGPNARWYLDGASAAGLPAARVHWAPRHLEAMPMLRSLVRAGDLVLIKGSRGIEMEHLVEGLRYPALAPQP